MTTFIWIHCIDSNRSYRSITARLRRGVDSKSDVPVVQQWSAGWRGANRCGTLGAAGLAARMGLGRWKRGASRLTVP